MGTDARHNPFSKESAIELPPVMFDRLERPLQRGDAVLLPGVSPTLIWEVLDCVPIVDPTAPRNMGRLTVRTTFHLQGPRQTPLAEVLQIRAVGEREPVFVPAPPEKVSLWEWFKRAYREARDK